MAPPFSTSTLSRLLALLLLRNTLAPPLDQLVHSSCPPTGPSPRIFCPCPAPGHLPPQWLPYPPCLLTHPPPLTTSAGIQASPLNPCRILRLRRPFPLGPAFPPSAPQLGHPTQISRRRFFNREPEDAEATRNSSSLCDRGDATAGEGGGKGISLTR